MIKNYFAILLFFGLLSCNEKAKKIEPRGSDLKLFMVESVGSSYDLRFFLPKTFVSVKDLTEEEQMDTTNLELNWILDMQFEFPDSFLFYDSSQPNFNILVRAGPRIDISNKERKVTYFTVPTAPLNKFFPTESDLLEITYDSGEKKYKDKTYYHRTYRGRGHTNTASSDYYYVTTKQQSTLIVINSLEKVNMEKYILDYEILWTK